MLQLFIQKGFALRPRRRGNSYPFTLTLENDSIALPVVGRPIEEEAGELEADLPVDPDDV